MTNSEIGGQYIQKPVALPPQQILDDLVAEIKNRTSEPELPTGIKPLDDAIRGLRRKAVTIVGGRTGEAKSSLLGFMAHWLAECEKKVLFLSLEMPKEEILERMMCNFCDVSGNDLQQGMPDNLEPKIKAFRESLTHKKLRIIDGYGYDFKEIEYIITEKFGDGKPDVVFIDHIQKISSAGFHNRRDAVAEYINTLEKIALRENIAVVAACQLNREAAKSDAPPKLEHCKDAGAIEETGATVLLCWWPTRDTENNPRNIQYKIIVGKQRHGPAGDMINCYFYADKSRFSSMPKDSWENKNEKQITASF